MKWSKTEVVSAFALTAFCAFVLGQGYGMHHPSEDWKAKHVQVRTVYLNDPVTTTTVAPTTTTSHTLMSAASRSSQGRTPVSVTTTTSTTGTGYGPAVRDEPSQGRATGRASWYAWKAGNCASRDIAKGTTVRVYYHGKSATCTVGDYGPAAWTQRIIDLDKTVFVQLAPASEGVIDVVVTW